MAILDGIKGLEMFVDVTGRGTSKEYADEEETTPTHASKYIEAVTGAEFTVKYCFTPQFESKANDFAIRVTIDGTLMDIHVIQSHKFGTGGYKNCFHGALCQLRGQWQVRKFTFTELIIHEDHSSKIDESIRQRVANLGKITISVFRATVIGKGKYTNSNGSSGFLDTPEISEKALKGRALSHAVRLQSAQNHQEVPIVKVNYIDSLNSPYAVFDFKYRSLQTLKELRILSRSPTPVPLEARPVDTPTLEESRELLRRFQAEKAAESVRLKREVKRERSESDDDVVSFMNERPCKAQRTSGEIVTIDLT